MAEDIIDLLKLAVVWLFGAIVGLGVGMMIGPTYETQHRLAIELFKQGVLKREES